MPAVTGYDKSRYRGKALIDMGPLTPIAKTMIPSMRNNVHGVECRLETMDFGRISAETYDDLAILALVDASNSGVSLRRSLMIRIFPNPRLPGIPVRKFSYSVVDENPCMGMMGEPVCARLAGKGLMKAVALHGQVIFSEKRDSSWGPIIVFNVAAGSVQATCACRADTRCSDIAGLPGKAQDKPWVVVSGYGNIASLKIDGYPAYRLYLHDIRNFRFSSPSVPQERKIAPDAMMKSMRPGERHLD